VKNELIQFYGLKPCLDAAVRSANSKTVSKSFGQTLRQVRAARLLVNKLFLEKIDPLVAFFKLDIRTYKRGPLKAPSSRLEVSLLRRHARMSREIVDILKNLLAFP
jgi:hypothetical protein